MKSLLAAAAAVALTTVAAPAFAQADPYAHTYAGIGYSHYPLNVDTNVGDSSDQDLQIGAITGRVGGRFNRFFAVELDASVGVVDDSYTISPFTFDVGLEGQVGAHLVGMFPISPATDLFARAGVNYFQFRVEVDAPVNDFNDTDDTTAWSAGLGVQHFFDGVNGVRAEYTRYEFQDEGDADAFTLSYVRKFGGR